MKIKEKGGFISFNGHKYALNLDALKKVCLSSSSDGGTNEIEISEAYERVEDGTMALASKINHETKVKGNPQNDMIIYDIVKLLLVSILEKDAPEDMFAMDLGLSLSLNTLISWGVIEEVK